MEKHEAAKRGMSGEKKGEKGRESEKPKSRVHRMEIERADGGGYIVHHHHEPMKGKEGAMEHKPMTKHVVADADDLQDHVQQNMGDQPAAGEAPEPDEPQVAPAQAGADPMMGAGQ